MLPVWVVEANYGSVEVKEKVLGGKAWRER